jgi:hypothetical protein
MMLAILQRAQLTTGRGQGRDLEELENECNELLKRKRHDRDLLNP